MAKVPGKIATFAIKNRHFSSFKDKLAVGLIGHFRRDYSKVLKK